MERLDDAQQVDRAYHVAKLTAAAFNDPPRIWDEHEEYRRSLLAPAHPESPAMDRSAHLDLALSVQQRMVTAGIIPPHSGAVN